MSEAKIVPWIISDRCEDYPCCQHGPPPMGDGGGCPVILTDGVDEWQQWRCASCGTLMVKGYGSAICQTCADAVVSCYQNDCPGCPKCMDPEDIY
jgi:hypothetical protein